MDVNTARQLVVTAGKELVASGLIARTWGNVSCRVDDKSFAITPSGRSYETLQPDEIVICKIEDTSYEGEIKPSSEKGIHALVYRIHPDINFVIHTHQPIASVISAARISTMPSGNYPLLSDRVPIAAYGLPGTKKLRENIRIALENSKSHAVIMANHGVLCFGRDYKETFTVAKQLEEACQNYLQSIYLSSSGALEYDEKSYYEYFAANLAKPVKSSTKPTTKPTLLYNSRRTRDGFILEGETVTNYCFSGTMSPVAVIHRDIYLKRRDINYIVQDVSHGLFEISNTNSSLKPFLDDFAQLIGGTVRCAGSVQANDILKALGKRMGVLVPGCGALCIAVTEGDLHAVQLVMEKNALTAIGTQYIGGSRTIGSFDSELMHFVYKKSYSKRSINKIE